MWNGVSYSGGPHVCAAVWPCIYVFDSRSRIVEIKVRMTAIHSRSLKLL